jgi:hypothetical protein
MARTRTGASSPGPKPSPRCAQARGPSFTSNEFSDCGGC